MCTLIFGSSGAGEATNMGYMLMAFGLGLIPYSVQYVVLRAFYAYEDTRTPFYNTVIVAAVNAAASALCFCPARPAGPWSAWRPPTASPTSIGVGVAWRRLSKRLGGDLDGAPSSCARTRGSASRRVPAATARGAAVLRHHATALGRASSARSPPSSAVASYCSASSTSRRGKMRIEELNAMVGMVRGRLGR